jgi:H+/Cl- antiporter ClcA
MNNFLKSSTPINIAASILYWALLIAPLSFVVGSLVALFLWLLDLVTTLRWNNLSLICLLPVAGLLITFLYKKWGKNAEAGNNLVIDEIHQPGGGIPISMAPLVLVSTIITHLFGGSAGREGTAVQIGGSLAALFERWYKLQLAEKQTLLMCGIAAGFGAVFGTPVAGAIFALEVLTIGKIKYSALLPCLIASVLADVVCAAYGIHHTRYHINFLKEAAHQGLFSFDFLLLIKVIVGGVAFGLVAYSFSALSHFIKKTANKFIQNKWLIPVIGGSFVIAISYAIGTFDYLGLGVTNPGNGVSIVSSFNADGATTWSWFWKLLLTAITLSTGFKGGEVTPLFFIGAALGNTIATITGSPVDLFAGLGFIAVFAGATNTPLACTLMGVELFGTDNLLYYAVACFTAYYFSGHTGIYSAQRIGVTKFHVRDDDDNATTASAQNAEKTNIH